MPPPHTFQPLARRVLLMLETRLEVHVPKWGSGDRIVPVFLASPPRKWEILGVERERGSRPGPLLQMSRLMMWSDILSPELDNLFGAPEELFCRIAGQVTR